MMLDAGRWMLVGGIALLYLFNKIGSIPCLSSIQKPVTSIVMFYSQHLLVQKNSAFFNDMSRSVHN
jgi:hypothetical protein